MTVSRHRGAASVAVAAPVEVVVHHARCGRRTAPSRARRAPVDVVARQVVAGLEPEDRRVGDELAADRACVGVEQQLVRVEPQALVGLPRAVGAEAVALARGAGRARRRARCRGCARCSWCRVSCRPSSSNRHTHIAVASGAWTAKLVDSSLQVAPSGQVRPGQTATRSSAADHSPGVTRRSCQPGPNGTSGVRPSPQR